MACSNVRDVDAEQGSKRVLGQDKLACSKRELEREHSKELVLVPERSKRELEQEHSKELVPVPVPERNKRALEREHSKVLELEQVHSREPVRVLERSRQALELGSMAQGPGSMALEQGSSYDDAAAWGERNKLARAPGSKQVPVQGSKWAEGSKRCDREGDRTIQLQPGRLKQQ